MHLIGGKHNGICELEWKREKRWRGREAFNCDILLLKGYLTIFKTKCTQLNSIGPKIKC